MPTPSHLLRLTSVVLALALTTCTTLRRDTHPAAAMSIRAAGLSHADCLAPNACVNIVNIGQGNCVHVTCPNGDQALIDCGSTISPGEPAAPSAFPAAAYFTGMAGQTNLKSVLITHGDIDHYTHIVNFFTLDKFTHIEKVVVGKGWRDWPNKQYKIVDWLNSAASLPTVTFTELGTASRDTKPTSALSCANPSGGPEGFYVIAADVAGDKNTRSIVLRYQARVDSQGSILLPGDATNKTERDTLQAYTTLGRMDLLDVDFYLIAHHGAEGSKKEETNTPEWRKALSPKVLAFSSAGQKTDGKKYYHPRCNVAGKYEHESVWPKTNTHPFGCWDTDARPDPKWHDNLDYTQRGMLDTWDSGMIVFRVSQDTPEVWRCPDNDLTTTCQQIKPE